jgi:hypothetical protein
MGPRCTPDWSCRPAGGHAGPSGWIQRWCSPADPDWKPIMRNTHANYADSDGRCRIGAGQRRRAQYLIFLASPTFRMYPDIPGRTTQSEYVQNGTNRTSAGQFFARDVLPECLPPLTSAAPCHKENRHVRPLELTSAGPRFSSAVDRGGRAARRSKPVAKLPRARASAVRRAWDVPKLPTTVHLAQTDG